MQRLTRQRSTVFSAFSDHDRALTAPEILAHAQADMPGISLSTVYRQVSLLLANGEINKVELPGEPARYEVSCKTQLHAHSQTNNAANGHHHHYFCCTNCKQVFRLHSCPGPMKELAPPGFEVFHHEVTLHGLCATCATAGHPSSTKSGH